MSFDSDVVVLGTGLAPLVGATHLLAQGKSVLLLNPDRDFFLEDSELPLDPLFPKPPTIAQISRSLPEATLNTLRPEFPGAVEFWQPGAQSVGYHDFLAPHVRSRGRLWISSPENRTFPTGETLERLYVEASDAGYNPQILEGLSASRRFPGFSSSSSEFSGILIPKLCDVDVARYRNGLLEFIRERLGPERVILRADQMERMPGGIRFHNQGVPCTARIKEGALVCWTPKLTSWVLAKAKQAEVAPQLPLGVRLWEQWSLALEKSLDPHTVGVFNNMSVWTDFEGLPSSEDSRNTTPLSQLAVLRAGPLVSLESYGLPDASLNWASAESFDAISGLCHRFLKWNHFSVRAFRPKAILEWEKAEPWLLNQSDPPIHIVPGCDGPVVDIVRLVRSACDRLSQNMEE